jgi:hypothetical protein
MNEPVGQLNPKRDETAAPHRTPGHAKGILWLASYPKSGNTWTRAFLHNLFGLLEGKDIEYDINKINEFTTWDISAQAYSRHMGEAPSADNKALIAATRPKVQADIVANTEGLAIVKTHHALVEDRGYPVINFKVTSGAVYVVRNPLDVAISFAHHMGSDIDKAIEHMAIENYETPVTEKSVYEIYGSWSQHVESWTRRPHRAIHVMRYEDMLDEPEKTFGKLARFLLLTPTSAQLKTAIERASFKRLQEQEAAHGFREKPERAKTFFREGRSGQWRERLTRRQIRTIVKVHGRQMAKFNYLSDELVHLA